MAAVGPRFCSHCGQPLAEAANFCSSCGTRVSQAQQQAPPGAPVRVAAPAAPKRMVLVVLLAIVPALFGVYGIGHLYVGRVGRGLVILLGQWLVAVIAVALLVAGFLSPATSTLIALAFLFFAASLALMLWQIFDAVSLARRWNRHVAQMGERPW